MNRYFVTGSSGFIGTNFIEKALASEVAVCGFDIKEPLHSAHRDFFCKGSLLDEQRLLEVMQRFQPTHVIHLGARTDLDGTDVSQYLENTAGLENLIRCCDLVSSVERVVFASSRLVCKIGYQPNGYDDYCPSTAYGESKVAGEQIIKSMPPKRWSWCIVRPTSIWGEWFGVPYRNFFDVVRQGRYLHPAGVKVFKSFGYVGNVVHELWELGSADEAKVGSKCFYVGDYEQIEVMKFAEEIAEKFNAPKVKTSPLWILKVAAALGDFLALFSVKFPLTSFRLVNLLTPMPHDFSDLRQVIGDLPYSREQGILNTVIWMKDHPNV